MSEPASEQVLAKYVQAFGKLKRQASKEFGNAPHKPILLLALLDELERGAFSDGLITPSPELVVRFGQYWDALVPGTHWQERMQYPFRHLYQEGFWHFVRGGIVVGPDPERMYSLKQLAAEFDGVRLSPDLWLLLQNRVALAALRRHLLDTYFPNQAGVVAVVTDAVVDSAVNYEAVKLQKEAESKFRVKRAKETAGDDGYYVRHALFPRVVKDLYGGACAACRLSAGTAAGSGIVDAAHIMPFAEFHNDDPRNGLALCKNHHWGFDAGWFAVAADYSLVVSSRLVSDRPFVAVGEAMLLPQEAKYWPAPEALAWHRANRFLG